MNPCNSRMKKPCRENHTDRSSASITFRIEWCNNSSNSTKEMNDTYAAELFTPSVEI